MTITNSIAWRPKYRKRGVRYLFFCLAVGPRLVDVLLFCSIEFRGAALSLSYSHARLDKVVYDFGCEATNVTFGLRPAHVIEPECRVGFFRH